MQTNTILLIIAGVLPGAVSAAPPQPAEPRRRLGRDAASHRAWLDGRCSRAAGLVAARLRRGAVRLRCAAGKLVRGRFVQAGRADDRASDEPGASTPSGRDTSTSTRESSGRCSPRPRRKPASCRPSNRSDPVLAAALLPLAVHETADESSLVAAAYRNAGVLDYAYRHYQRALEARAVRQRCTTRAWRGCGGTGACPTWRWATRYRAIHCQPKSASAHNTLGTVLQSLGQHAKREARLRASAARSTRSAAFALNNLCYLALPEGNGAAAQQACERALALDPTTASRRGTNLALAYAHAGRSGRSRASAAGLRRRRHGASTTSASFACRWAEYADAADAFDPRRRAANRRRDARQSAPCRRERSRLHQRGAIDADDRADLADASAANAPRTLEEAGLERDLVTQLVLKTLHLSGELTGTELARPARPAVPRSSRVLD